jgi:hypothetical protein
MAAYSLHAAVLIKGFLLVQIYVPKCLTLRYNVAAFMSVLYERNKKFN